MRWKKQALIAPGPLPTSGIHRGADLGTTWTGSLSDEAGVGNQENLGDWDGDGLNDIAFRGNKVYILYGGDTLNGSTASLDDAPVIIEAEPDVLYDWAGKSMVGADENGVNHGTVVISSARSTGPAAGSTGAATTTSNTTGDTPEMSAS